MPANSLRIVASLLILVGIGIALIGYLRATAPAAVDVTEAQSVTREEKTRRVVVASRDIEANAVIRAADIAVTDRTITPGSASSQYLSSPARVLGKRASVGIAKDQALTPDLLAAPPAVTPLATVVSPGHKALAVEVNEVEAAGGYLAPGDKVDLVWFFDSRGDAGPTTRVLAHGVRVLAVGEVIDREASGSVESHDESTGSSGRSELVDGIRELRATETSASERQPRVRSVVLELIDKDVARVVLAARSGKIRLAVHSSESLQEGSDDEVSAESGATVESLNALLGVSEPEASRESPQKSDNPAPEPPKRVRVFNGSESTTVEVD